jgi:hypothetical protein
VRFLYLTIPTLRITAAVTDIPSRNMAANIPVSLRFYGYPFWRLWWYYKVIDYKDDDTKGRGQPDYLDDEAKQPARVRSLLVI